MLWEDGERFRVAKIGDPDQYLSWGTHVFEIRYSIAGVLDPGTTGADKTFAADMGALSASHSAPSATASVGRAATRPSRATRSLWRRQTLRRVPL